MSDSTAGTKVRRRLTPTERSMSASIAALARWSRENPAEQAAKGQAGLRAKFLGEIDAEFPGLLEPERQRRADVRFREHMKRIRYRALRSGGR